MKLIFLLQPPIPRNTFTFLYKKCFIIIIEFQGQLEWGEGPRMPTAAATVTQRQRNKHRGVCRVQMAFL